MCAIFINYTLIYQNGQQLFESIFAPSKVIRWIPQSGKFACGIWNPALEAKIQLYPANYLNPESKFHLQGIRNPVPGIRNRWREIQTRTSGLSWITSNLWNNYFLRLNFFPRLKITR